MNGAAIRPAAPGDAPEIARLAGQLGYPTTPERIVARLEALFAAPANAVLVAENPAGGLAGWIHVGTIRWLESEPCAEIGGLIVDEACRGAKLGERLVAAAIGWAEREGFGEIRVRSNVVRADAHRFYERLGFARTKAQQVFRLPLEGEPVPE